MTRMFQSGPDSFESLCSGFRWQIPECFNIAEAVCDRHRGIGERVAVICENESGEQSRFSFARLLELSNRLANAFTAVGVGRGDRIAVVLPQRIETALVHLAAWKLGAITVPLSVLFGPEALEYRLSNSGARLVVTDGAHRAITPTDCGGGSSVVRPTCGRSPPPPTIRR